MRRIVARAPILSFTILAFSISWMIWVPVVFGRGTISPATALIAYYAGVIGPTVAALLCTDSSVAFAALRRRLTLWRVSFRWYAIAILLPFVVRGIAVGVVFLAGGSAFRIVFRRATLIAQTLLLMLLLVPFEEIGWRGYALPILQRRYGPLAASLVLGGIWALWHLPLAWAPVGYQRSAEPWRYMVTFAVTILPISCLATWLFNKTSESVVIASLYHVAVNMADFVLVLPADVGDQVLQLTTAISAAIVVALWWNDRAQNRVYP